MKNTILTTALLVMLLSGAVYSYQLTTVVEAEGRANSACSANAIVDCGKNLQSAYGSVSGIPVSTFATIFFVLCLGISLLQIVRGENRKAIFGPPLLFGYLAGMAVIYYLLISIFVLHSICLYCVVLYGIVALTIGISYAGLQAPLSQQPSVFLEALKASLHAGAHRRRVLTVTTLAAAFVCLWLSGDPGSAKKSALEHAFVNTTGMESEQEPIAITVFGDFECPACKMTGLGLERLNAEFPGKLAIHFVNYPLCHDCNPEVPSNLHTHACLAAKVGLVMKSRGKFDAYCHKVYAEASAPDERRLYEIVSELGEREAEIRRQANDVRTAEALSKEIEFGNKAGVRATPTLLVDGKMIQGGDVLAQIKVALESGTELANGSLLVNFSGDTSAHGFVGARQDVASRGTVAARGTGPNIYVAQNTSGGNTGADCANAHSAAWFNNSADWGTSAGQVGPGATVHFCGVISNNLTVSGSGSTGNPITLFFEPGAKLSQAAGGPFITMNNKSFVVVDGGANGIIENTNARTTGQHVSSQAIVASPCTNCEIKNLTVQNIYIHTGSATEIEQTQSNCVVFSGDNFLIHDNTMHDVGWCLFLQGSGVNNRIYNNDIYNVDHAIIASPGAKSAPAGPLYIYNNHVHDYANWDNSSNGYHHDGIHCYTVPGPYPQPAGIPVQGAHWNGLWIYNNLFDGNIGNNVTGHIFLEPGVQTDGSATPCMDATSQIHIFGNTLIGTTANGTIDLGRDGAHPLTTPVDFYNNTIFGSDASEGRSVVFENVKTVNAFNNVVGGANKLWDGVSFSNTDYNGYINCPIGTSFNCWPVNGGANNFSTWKSLSGSDAHGINSQADFDGVNSTTGLLQAGSLMIGKGRNLSSAVTAWPSEQQAALATDRSGKSRGTGNWDVGANAASTGAGSGPAITAQPASQTVFVGQAATFSVTATGTAALTYQWRKNNVPISGATSASYTAPASTTADSGSTFLVIVSNAIGSATSSSATLTVKAAPQGMTLLTSQIPVALNNSDGAGVNYELGMRFSSTAAGAITAVRFWKDSLETGAHTGRIWNASGTLLASVAFSGETASGWQEQALATPLSVAANTEYLVSVNTGNTFYVAADNGLATQIVNGSLSSVVGSNGRYGSVGQFPTQTFQNSNYFRDVRFVASAVNHSPVLTSAASATPNSAMIGQSISFNVAASDPDGDTLTYSWNFGDGSSSSGSAATHAYSAAGTYTIVVAISDGKGGIVQSSVSATIVSAINIASQATAYRWFGMRAASSTTNRVAAPGLNDNDLRTNVDLSGAGSDTAKAFEAAGMTWPSAQTFMKVIFQNGSYTSTQDGVFDAGFALQSSSDGTTWTPVAGWGLTPAYAYNSPSAGGVAYTFSGPPITAKGVRCVGQVRTSSTGVNSWFVNVTEMQVFSSAAGAMMLAATESIDSTRVDLGTFKLNQPLKIVVAPSVSSKTKSKTRWVYSALSLPRGVHFNRGTLSGRPKAKGAFMFDIQVISANGNATTSYLLTVSQ